MPRLPFDARGPARAALALLVVVVPALAVPPQDGEAPPRAPAPESQQAQQPEQEPDDRSVRPDAQPLAEERGSNLFTLDDVVVTATRSPIAAFDAPYAAESITAGEVLRRGYRTTPQALRNVPGVLVQETATGQGSPYIRGFTGYQTLFLVDGVRLNNSVFRAGPNQYWNTVDPYSLGRYELVKGPSSVLYGSDAIGGTLNAFTLSPYGWDPDRPVQGRVFGKVASADDSVVGRGEVSAYWDPTLGFLFGATWKDFGDVRAGDGTGLQRDTGYDEWDGDLKIEKLLGDDKRLTFLHQEVHVLDAPRTHQTVFAESFEGSTVGSDLRRDLSQDRTLSYLKLDTWAGDGLFDTSETTLSFHQQDEERERTRSNGRMEEQGFEVDTLGLSTTMTKESGIGRLTWGLDFYHDDVSSFLDRNAFQTPADDIQGPVADDATYDTLGVFLQDAIDVTERLEITLGARFNRIAADADSVRDPVTDTEVSIDEEWSQLVGSVRFLYELEPERWHLFGGVSQGFRAPNLSDLTRFDTARSNEFEIPAPGLDPEHYLAYELGVKRQTDDTALQTALFYTDVSDSIVRFPTGNVDDNGTPADPSDDVFEITKDNVGDGWVAGLEVGAAHRFADDWTVFGNGTYMEGKVDTYPTSAPTVEREWIDRLMPLTLQLGLRWEEAEGRTWAEALAVWMDDGDKLSTRDEGDTSRIPPGGTPGWATLDLRGGWRATERIEVLVGVENLFDEDYRVHGSGHNMPGRNLWLAVSVSF